MIDNIISLSDSYKYSHYLQYPENTVSLYDYAEARSGNTYEKTVFFGLQYYLKQYLQTPITMEMVDEAYERAKLHGIPFNYSDWSYIASLGYIPVKIKAVPEGTMIPTGLPLFSIESTDDNVPWIVGHLETLLMKVWYPSNIATRSYYIKKMLMRFAEKTQVEPSVHFQLHNFGDRGASSVESAGIGGLAHLTQFSGTDNFNSLNYGKEFYSEEMPGFSIVATEHSTVTSWGKDKEFDFYDNYIETFQSQPIVACVMDSYDYLKAVDYVTKGGFKDKIESDNYPIFVIRPDSGDPVDMINSTLDIMEYNKVKFTVNGLGFKKFNKYGIIWGDGISESVMNSILKVVVSRGYDSSTVAFGMGGALMHGNPSTSNNRDTQGWAVKCSNIVVDEGDFVDEGDVHGWEEHLVNRDVFKDPITARSKKSKKGRITTLYNPDKDEYYAGDLNHEVINGHIDVLKTVYEDGEILKEYSLTDVRENSKG